MPSAEPFEVLASEPEGSGGEGWRLLLRIPPDTSLCDGHFPGHPIVPGVAHLAWVERALADRYAYLQGDGPARRAGITAIRGFRLRRPVQPGDELELQLRPAFTFALRQGAEAVSDGRVEEGRVEDSEVSEARASVLPSLAVPPDGFPPIESLIPHRGPMRLLRQVLGMEDGALLGEAAVPASNPLVRGGRTPAWLALEAAAQAAAALESLARREQDTGPQLGYLVGVREARMEAPDLAAGIPFQVFIRPQGSAPPLAKYEVEAGRDGTPILTAILSTYVPPG